MQAWPEFARSSPRRRVQRLRVSAPDDVLAWRARNLLEDALRTASLPDAGGRLLVVRSLALRFGAGVSPQALSLALEQRVAELGVHAVPFDSPAAASAPAVRFRDALEAHVKLALRIAGAMPAVEWFWPIAVRGFDRHAPRDAQLRAVVLSLAAREEAPAALPRLVHALVAAGHGEMLLACLDESDAAALIAASGAAPRTRRSVPPAFAAVRKTVLPPLPGWIGNARLRPGAEARVRWVAAMLEAAGAMPRASVLRAEAAHRHEASAGAERRPVPHGLPEAPATVPTQTRPVVARRAEGTSTPEEPATAGSGDAHGERSEAPRAAPLNERIGTAESGTDHGEREEAQWPDSVPTAAGGLLFLLPVLARLGYPPWLEEDEERATWQIERRLLALVCERLALPPGDPAWLLTVSLPPDPVPAARIDAETRSWLAACRRWLRLRARIGIASLVRRPARITITPTHADVVFDLASADLAVRRAGLDLDPGWLPWYGRVVTFHYVPSVNPSPGSGLRRNDETTRRNDGSSDAG